MVWKEQMVTIAVESDGLALEGVWQAGKEGGAVVAAPHPLFGGSLGHPVVNEIAHALFQLGYASLRFNWRGVGASQGVSSAAPGDAERDYRASLQHLIESTSEPWIAAGYSFGAAAALRVGLSDARLRELLLVAPPLEMVRDLAIGNFQGPVHVVVGGRDQFSPFAELAACFADHPQAHVEVIPDADHFFMQGGLAELAELIRSHVG